MLNGLYRIAIVGASSLLGRELADVLSQSALNTSVVALLDDEETTGQMTVAGDEVAVIERLTPESFERMDFVFFAGSPAATGEHWQAARRAGASIVDLTGALELEPGASVRAPWVFEARGGSGPPPLDLGLQAVVAAHPAAVMLALLAAHLERGGLEPDSLAATVLEPASAHGRAAMDELHRQTVNLLSFQSLPREEHDAQVAFNLLPSLGDEARVRSAIGRIAAHYAALGAERWPVLLLQIVHAPVFHGYACSVLVELAQPVTLDQVEAALAGNRFDLVAEGSDPPSNLSAAGHDQVLLQVRPAGPDPAAEKQTRFWVWMAADNLRLAAINGAACALELRRLRPRGTVQ